jgi:sugar phosphate permease
MFAETLARWLGRRGIHYGWVMVALTFLTMLATAAVMGLVAVLILPLKAEFGWDTGDISAAFGLRVMLYGSIAPFAAAFLARFGVRRIVSVALALVLIGLAGASQVTSLWQLWVTWGLIVGLATGMTALVLGATVASRWFAARRGLVVGLFTASNATGQLLFLPLAAWMTEHYGWRMAMVPPLIACTLAWALMLLLGRDHPSELGLAPFGESVVVPPPPRLRGNPFSASLSILRDVSAVPMFWVLFGTFFVCGLSTNGLVQSHFVPLCHDFGVDAAAATGLLAVIGAFDFIGTIVSGWLSDRFSNRNLLFVYYGLRGLSLMALPYTNFSMVGLSVFAVFYGLDWVATVPPTVRLTADTFGRAKAPIIFGWIFMAHQLGGAVAVVGAGVMRDSMGTYLPAFFASGVLCLVAAVAILWKRRQRAVA